MKVIKVVHIVEDLKIGGIERVIANIVLGLNREKFSPSVWCLSKGGEIADELSQKGIKVEIFDMKSHRNPFFYLKLAKKLKKEKIDIIHTHGYTGTTIGRIAGIIAGVKGIFSHLHSTYCDFSKKQIFIEKILSGFTEKIICCSKAVQDFAVSFEKIKKEKTVVVYNGIEKPEKLLPKNEAKKKLKLQGHFVVGSVASFFFHKGGIYLLESAVEIVRKFPETAFLMAGKGPLLKEYRQFVKRHDLTKNVFFMEKCENIFEVISAMDVFVLPSSQREGLGIALIEAMAMGVPLIGTAIGGIPEVIEDGKNGFLVPAKNSHAVARAIEKIILNPSLAKRMADCGRKIYEEKFTAKKMLQKIENLYKDVFKIRVAYISAFSDIIGGGQISMLELLKRINKDEFLVFLILPGKGELYKKSKEPGIRAEVISFPSFKSLNFFEILRAVFKLRKFIKENRIKIIHTDLPRHTFYSAIAKFLLKVKLISHSRTGEREFFVDRLLEFFCNKIICVSKDVSKRFFCKSKIKVIYNGVDTEKFSPEGRNLRDELSLNDIIVIGTVLRKGKIKGAIDFIEMARTIFKSRKDVKFLIAGSIDEDREVLEMAQSIRENVIFFGERRDMPEVYRTFDIFVLPTHTEGFSRSIIEAMACGCPVVATDVGGNGEAVSDGKTGFIVPKANPEKLAEAVLKLMTDRALRKKFSVFATKSVREKFSIEKNVFLTEKVYRSFFK